MSRYLRGQPSSQQGSSVQNAAESNSNSTMRARNFLRAVTGSEYLPLDSTKIKVRILWNPYVVVSLIHHSSQINFVRSFSGVAMATLSVRSYYLHYYLLYPHDYSWQGCHFHVCFKSIDVLINPDLLVPDLDTISDSVITVFDQWVDSLTTDYNNEYNAL